MTSSIYRDRILRHYKEPEHAGTVADPDIETEVANEHCGDELHITATVSDGRFETVRFDGDGCALSIAAADLLADAVEGEPIDTADIDEDGLFDMLGLSRDAISPMRLKCVLLMRDGLLSMVTDDDDA